MRMRLLPIVILLLGAFPPPSAAQSPVAHVALLGAVPVSDPAERLAWQAFVAALRERGWVEGHNLAFELRSGGGRPEHYPELAAELVALQPDVIIAVGTQPVKAVREKTDTIPIVMISVPDPIGLGYIESFARPGGNITGVSNQFGDIIGKALQLLTEVRPGLSRVGFLWVPDNPAMRFNRAALEAIAPQLGLTIEPIEVKASEDFDAAFDAVARSRPDALLMNSPPLFVVHRSEIIAFALDHQLPAIGNFSWWAREGLLMSYGPDWVHMWRRMADYVDKILRGAKPTDLPVEQPTKFELVINRKTADALGLTIPPALLARADEVIE
jgi:putative ABC transport system substrate-binding protein